MNATKEQKLFETCKETEAVLRLAIPTVAGQIILVIYNMADTFFVGLTGDDAMLTAVTVCMPAFMFLSAVSNLFGVGGASVISRALGSGQNMRIRAAAAFAFWGCLGTTLLYSLLALVGMDLFVDLLGGTNPSVHSNAVSYLLCTVVLGGIFTSGSMLLAHLVRAEGRSVHASAGIALGGILNIALDPLFMFVLLPTGNEALGAAVATTLSNCISCVYFIFILLRLRGRTLLSFYPSSDMIREQIPSSVLSAGLPACIMTLFENISYAILDKLMSFCGVQMQAGLGVAKKINMLAHCMVRGVAQGSLPLIGYNYAAGNLKRMRNSVRVSHLISIGLATVCLVVNLIFADALIDVFIRQGSPSHDYGRVFLRVLCVGGPFSASAYTIISFFQATGEGMKSFFLALMRKGIVDIPLMFLLQGLLPIYGIVLATPLADILCCVTANVMFIRYIRTLQEQQRERLIKCSPKLI